LRAGRCDFSPERFLLLPPDFVQIFPVADQFAQPLSGFVGIGGRVTALDVFVDRIDRPGLPDDLDGFLDAIRSLDNSQGSGG